MKDAGIFVGSCTSGYVAWDQIGDISVFNWFQVFLMGWFILLISIFGAIAGGVFQYIFLKLWNRWNGEKNGMRKYS